MVELGLELGLWRLELGLWRLQIGLWRLELGLWRLSFLFVRVMASRTRSCRTLIILRKALLWSLFPVASDLSQGWVSTVMRNKSQG